MKKLIGLIVCIIFCFVAKAEKVYEFNSTCQQAYKEIMQLKLDNGLQLIRKAQQQNPDNLIPLVLESYIDFFTLFFNEDPAVFKQRSPKFDERIKLLKEGKISNEKDVVISNSFMPTWNNLDPNKQHLNQVDFKIKLKGNSTGNFDSNGNEIYNTEVVPVKSTFSDFELNFYQ